MNIAKSTLKLFAGNSAAAGIQFLGIVYFSRELGATQMGIFFLFQAMANLLHIPTDIGLRGAIEKRLSEGNEQGAYLTTGILLKIAPISIVVTILLLSKPHVDSYIGEEVTLLLIAGVLLKEAATLSMIVLRGELRVGETAVLKSAKWTTWVCSGVLLMSLGFDAKGLIISYMLGMGVVLVWGWYKISTTLRLPSRGCATSLIEYGKFSLVSNVGSFIYSWMDVAIIGLFLTQAHVGAYETAWRVTIVMVMFSRALSKTIFPQISQWDAKEALDRVEKLTTKSIVPSLILVIPSFFGILVLSNEILSTIFGPEFTIAWVAMIVLAGEKVFQSIYGILSRALNGINQPRLSAISVSLSVGLNFVLNLILVYEFGILGAAVATTAAALLNTLLHIYYLSNFIDVSVPTRQASAMVISSLGMAGILLVFKNIITVDTVVELLLLIAIGVIFYFSIIFLIPSTRRTVKSGVKTILRQRQGTS